MQIHYFQHVPFEGPGCIAQWAEQKGHTLASTRFYNDYTLPEMDTFDWLVVMGGPMSTYDEDRIPWLKPEKRFIRETIDAGKIVIGICLGAQLIADALGARVYPGLHREIGWFPIELTPDGRKSKIFSFLPDRFTCFHWHGDTFDIPEGAQHTAQSDATRNQAFVFDERVVGLQFHLESTPESVADIVFNCAGEVVPDRFMQSVDMLKAAGPEHLDMMNAAMFGILDRLAQR